MEYLNKKVSILLTDSIYEDIQKELKKKYRPGITVSDFIREAILEKLERIAAE